MVFNLITIPFFLLESKRTKWKILERAGKFWKIGAGCQESGHDKKRRNIWEGAE